MLRVGGAGDRHARAHGADAAKVRPARARNREGRGLATGRRREALQRPSVAARRGVATGGAVGRPPPNDPGGGRLCGRRDGARRERGILVDGGRAPAPRRVRVVHARALRDGVPGVRHRRRNRGLRAAGGAAAPGLRARVLRVRRGRGVRVWGPGNATPVAA